MTHVGKNWATDGREIEYCCSGGRLENREIKISPKPGQRKTRKGELKAILNVAEVQNL